jgi:hypothetical protein
MIGERWRVEDDRLEKAPEQMDSLFAPSNLYLEAGFARSNCSESVTFGLFTYLFPRDAIPNGILVATGL